jgi:SNF2 family DNA or RNA helicase
VQLTGTPASNGLMKLWGQMFLLDRGEALGRTKGRFLATFFEQNPYTQRYELKKGMEGAIHRKVAPLVLRVDAADHMDMPPTITSNIKVHLTPKLMGQYKRFETDFLIKLESGGVFAAANAASLSGRLRQYCNGALYDTEHDWHVVHDLKLDALEDLLVSLDGEPLLLFYQFVSDGDRIQARFPQAVRLDDKDAMPRWRRGEVSLLIAHPASGGHGINIASGPKHTCYYGLPWSLELYDQSFGRLNGARAKTTSYVHHIIVSGTVEEHMSAVLQEKARTQADLLQAVKRPLTQAA